MADKLPDLEARSLTIRDAAGRPRLVLGLDDRLQPAVRLLGGDGQELASIRLYDCLAADDQGGVGAELRLAASDGTGHAVVSTSGSGGAFVELSGNEEDAGGLVCLSVEEVAGLPVAGMAIKDPLTSVGIEVKAGYIDFSGGLMGQGN